MQKKLVKQCVRLEDHFLYTNVIMIFTDTCNKFALSVSQLIDNQLPEKWVPNIIYFRQ